MKGFYFDRRDHQLLDIVNDVLTRDKSRKEARKLVYPYLHPHGIKEMAESRGLRIAYAVIHLLESLEAGSINDRLIVHQDRIELIDYKTHRVNDDSAMATLSQNYKKQLSLYREGIKRIWPDRPVKSGLLFTNSARLIWVD